MPSNTRAGTQTGNGPLFLTAGNITFDGDGNVTLPGGFQGILTGTEDNYTFSVLVGGAGNVTDGTQRMTLAADDPAVTKLTAILAALGGTLTVDLPANAATETTLIAVGGVLTTIAASVAASATEATLATRLSESDFDTKVGSLTETAPATDTASSGLNGRLQRIAQRLTDAISSLSSIATFTSNIYNLITGNADPGGVAVLSVANVTPGTSSGSLGKQVGSVPNTQATGVYTFGVRRDAPISPNADGRLAPMIFDANGKVWANAEVTSGNITTVSTVTNLSQMSGQAIALGFGNVTDGTQRVVLGNDSIVNVTGALTLTSGNVTVGGNVTVANGNLSINDGGNSVTVDAPVGTPVFVRLSDGSTAIATLPVSLASVPTHAVTQSGGWDITGNLTTVATVTTCATVTNLAQMAGQAIAMGTGTRSAGTQRVTVATDDVVQVAGNLTTLATVTNLAQLGGQAVAMGTGARSAGTLRVTVATDDVVPVSQSGTWNIATVTTVTTVAAVTNLAQLGGQAIAMGTGTRSAGTLRVTVATDDVVQVAGNLTTVATVTTVSTVTNLAQLGGQAVSMGSGTRDAGTQRVTIATNDLVPVAVSSGNVTVNGNVGLNAGTNNIGNATIAAIARGNLSSLTLAGTGNVTNLNADLDGVQITRTNVPLGDVLSERVSDTTGNSTALTIFGNVASTRNCVTAIHAFRTDAGNTPIYVDFRDGVAGAILWTIVIPPLSGANTPTTTLPCLFKTSLATPLAYDVSAATTSVILSISGFQSKA
jgi:hypothetical protein